MLPYSALGLSRLNVGVCVSVMRHRISRTFAHFQRERERKASKGTFSLARLTLPTFHRVDWEKKWEGKICGFCKYILHISQNEQKPTWPKFTITSRNVRRGFYKTTADTPALPILYKFEIKKTHSNPRAVLNQDALETWAARVR